MEPYASPDQPTQLSNELEGLLGEWAGPTASTGLRFANYLIDLVIVFVIYTAVASLITYLIFITHQSSYDDYIAYRYQEQSSVTYRLKYMLIYLIIRVIYYTIFEGASGGRTIGKFCTNTRAVRDNGERLTMRDAFLRTLSRLVPFETFSGFGFPWHDTWTHTTVVVNRKN